MTTSATAPPYLITILLESKPQLSWSFKTRPAKHPQKSSHYAPCLGELHQGYANSDRPGELWL